MSRMLGTVSMGVRAPIIREGDDLAKIVTGSILDAIREDGLTPHDRDIVAMTESIVARAQGNYCSVEDIAADIRAKFGGETVGVIFPILSRNRFSVCLKGIAKGAKKVVMSAPAKDDTPTFVLGVNTDKYEGQTIISNASCTTNCLGPVTKVLDDLYGIQKGLMTTIHAYTNGQSLVDVKCRDFRRSRAAAVNMIPTSTGAAKAMKLVMPSLDGKLHGQSIRVPVPNVSIVDLTAVLGKSVTKEELNNAFVEASKGSLKGIMAVDFDERVSGDFNTSSYSSIVAADLPQVICDDMIKVMAWYDNEWGYSNRLIDLTDYVIKKGL